jgi:hypothetical protein
VQEQLLVSAWVYVEGFLRSLARQFGQDPKEFWRLKEDFLQKTLSLSEKDLLPLTVYQNLRNSLHNKGLHFNSRLPKLNFVIGGYEFRFDQRQPVKISWEHIRELLVANSALLLTIMERPKVGQLAAFMDRNVVILADT